MRTVEAMASKSHATSRTVAASRQVEAAVQPALEPTLADTVRELENQYDGVFQRTTGEEGQVIVSLKMSNHDQISGTGATTADAVAHLTSRLEAFANAG